MIAMHGDGARAAKIKLLVNDITQVIFEAHDEKFALRVVRAYKHMGMCATTELIMSLESRDRSSNAMTALRAIKTRVLARKDIDVYVRHSLAKSLIWSRLFSMRAFGKYFPKKLPHK